MPPSFRTVMLVLTVAMANGCASFNDTIVVDVGDQFRLLQTAAAESDVNGRVVEAPRGFECALHARTTSTGPFATEREVNGTLRCVRIGTSDDVANGAAGR